MLKGKKFTIPAAVAVLLCVICGYLFLRLRKEVVRKGNSNNIGDIRSASTSSPPSTLVSNIEDSSRTSPRLAEKESAELKLGNLNNLDDPRKIFFADEKFLPFETIEKNDVQQLLSPHYTGPVAATLTEAMREDLETILFTDLKCILELDFESYIAGSKRVNPNYRGEYTQDGFQTHYAKYFESPILRLGLADAPLEVVECDLNSILPQHLHDLWDFPELRQKLGAKALFAKISLVTKNSDDNYEKTEIHYYYDKELSMFRPLWKHYEKCELPALEIPLFLRGKDSH
jgi:hypothetical protein